MEGACADRAVRMLAPPTQPNPQFPLLPTLSPTATTGNTDGGADGAHPLWRLLPLQGVRAPACLPPSLPASLPASFAARVLSFEP